ncbi:MAG: hypothetical protein Q8Q35_04405 [Nanoarchaeota archaeon]|nr:hypothetical protein [Nanoarchaeota archaeon]
MKKAVLFMFIALLLVTTIEARTLTEEVQIGNSITIDNQKVSVVSVDTKSNKAIICVNNVKGIVSRDSEKTINNVRVEVRSVTSNSARLRLESSCNNCIETDNSICFNECNINSDCNDNDETTIDQCLGTPRKCVYNKTTVPEPEKEPLKEIDIEITYEEPKKENKPSSLLATIINFISRLFN